MQFDSEEVDAREISGPGRARLVTRLVSAGSSPLVKTIGIVEAAFFAARVARSPPLAAITSTCARQALMRFPGGRAFGYGIAQFIASAGPPLLRGLQ
jgi:hypothetical protein